MVRKLLYHEPLENPNVNQGNYADGIVSRIGTLQIKL
jgi:hypothetical protein